MSKKRRLSVSSVSSISSVSSVQSLSLSSDSESDDQEDSTLKRPRLLRDRTNPFDQFDDDSFKQHFHLSKATVQYVLELIEVKLKRYTERNHPLSPINQLLITLRFYVCGSFYTIVNEDYGATKSTISRTVHRVTYYLSLEGQKSIKMPQTDDDKKRISNNFCKLANFPNICGIIGCIHIRIQSPNCDVAEDYRNENNWYSIKTQIICDSDQQINDITTVYPGSIDNNEIFNRSTIKTKFDNREFAGYYLLGDSCYNCKEYLLTPINQTGNLAEKRYNLAHKQTCDVFVKTVELLRQRFPCLTEGLKIFRKRIPAVIIATCFLHNLAIKFNDNININDEKSNNNAKLNRLNNDNDEVRQLVINSIFAN